MHALPQHVVQHAGRAVGGADLAQHGRRVVADPVDRPPRLPQQRALPAADRRIGIIERLRRLTATDALQRGPDRRDGRFGDFVAINAALRRGAHREADLGPHVAGVHLAVGLQRGHAPLGLAVHDRPVERRGSSIPPDPRVDHDAALPFPHRIGNPSLEERRDDELRPPQRDRLFGDAIVHVELDRDVVPGGRQIDVQPLGEAVERVREEEDAHGR